MEKEFDLSKKIENHFTQIENISYPIGFLRVEDVKEFIRILKEAGDENDWYIMLQDGEDGDITFSFNEWIDKLIGEDLK